MFVYRTCRVHLETVYTIIHKVLQMIHPVLLPGKRLPHRLRQRILLRNAQIILDTEPKPHVIPHPMQTADKQPMVFFLRIASRIPISFSRKLLIVPFLFSRKIITSIAVRARISRKGHPSHGNVQHHSKYRIGLPAYLDRNTIRMHISATSKVDR